ncbi:hypothetical protein PF003_g27216 [Phytophthora fragariae]|nr:hypothetical protein PF003_g27216 [Phytophthora fragariae]
MSWDKLKRTATSSSLEASVGAHVHMRVEDFVNLASRTSELFDMLLRTVLKFQFLSNGCLQFEKRNQASMLLFFLSAKDPTQHGTPSSGSVMVMPRLGEGWLVSRFIGTPVSRPVMGAKELEEEVSLYNLRLAGEAEFAQPSRCEKGCQRYAPEEPRPYWVGVRRKTETMARTNSALMMSLGTVNMWGFSPAYDVCSGFPEWGTTSKASSSAVTSGADGSEEKASAEPINILLSGPGDVRHVLATIARRRRWDPALKHRPVHIYLFEKSIETLSRDLLLLQVALDTNLPMRQRCNTFLEIFGNARVQERTSAYIEEQAKMLMDFVYNERGPFAGLVDLSHLKMRTHDDLIDTFRSWFQSVKFDVDTLRDHRLRHYYEVRYDYRDNLIDWDYTMNLKKIENASVIHIRQYRDWRNSGVAFEFGDQSYTVPNRTMAAYTEAKKKQQGSVLCRGLWTDIIVSPYISLGVHCEKPNKFAEQLFEIHNKGTGVEQNRHNTVEVAVYNVLSYLHEIETGKMYKMEKEHDIFSGIGDTEGIQDTGNQPTEDKSHSRFEEIVEETNQPKATEEEISKLQSAEAEARENIIRESLHDAKIIPLTGNMEDLLSKKRYTNLFDYVFISSQQCHVLQPSDDVEERAKATFTNMLRDGAAVDVESSVFMLPLKDEQRALYVTKLQEWMSQHSLEPTYRFGGKKEPSSQDMTEIKHAVLRFSYSGKKV